ncbi:MAG TPA: hypothetical protein VKY38_02740 [Azoarcus sp.]|nr:hypothetical protein [Azoarcus sp.]
MQGLDVVQMNAVAEKVASPTSTRTAIRAFLWLCNRVPQTRELARIACFVTEIKDDLETVREYERRKAEGGRRKAFDHLRDRDLDGRMFIRCIRPAPSKVIQTVPWEHGENNLPDFP